MVRGPMALFGAIIAVGLGPALWLGAQFGQITVDPTVPKAPITADAPKDSAPGRAGAAVDEAGLDTKLNVVPDKSGNGGAGRQVVPLSGTPSVSASSRPPVVGLQPRTPSVAPTTPAPTTPTPSSTPSSAPATESSAPPPVEPPEPPEPDQPDQPDPPVEPSDEASPPVDTPSSDAGPITEVESDPVPPAAPDQQA